MALLRIDCRINDLSPHSVVVLCPKSEYQDTEGDSEAERDERDLRRAARVHLQ
jgi:hypothetical protein